MRRVVIVADDLVGAADCGVGFAQRGLATRVVLDVRALNRDEATVTALDTDTRDQPPPAAARRVADAMAATGATDIVFKKLDSTLRGNIAAELGAVCRHRPDRRVLLAPAFPATGRTTRAGCQLVHGTRLQDSEFAGQIATSSVRELVSQTGLPISMISLEDLRQGRLTRRLGDAAAGTLLICDAETDRDLAVIAEVGTRSAGRIVWAGSAGLARGLAGALAPADEPPVAPAPVVTRPLLLIAGSPARATQDQLRRLRGAPGLVEITVTSRGGGGDARGRARAALESGCDVVLTLEGEPDQREHGRDGTRRLARVAGAISELAGALVMTGGETARCVLDALGVTAIALQREIAPGIALGRTEGSRALPVALKAGGFGDEDALAECRGIIHANRKEAPTWVGR